MTVVEVAAAITRGEGAGGNREVPSLRLPAGTPGVLRGRRGSTGETWFPLWEGADDRMSPATDRVLAGASRRAA